MGRLHAGGGGRLFDEIEDEGNGMGGEGMNLGFGDEEFEAYGHMGDASRGSAAGVAGEELEFNFFEEDAFPQLPDGEGGVGGKRGRFEFEHDGEEAGMLSMGVEDDAFAFGKVRVVGGSSVTGESVSTVTVGGTRKRRKVKKSFVDAKIEIESGQMGIAMIAKQSAILNLWEKEKQQKALEMRMKTVVHNALDRFSIARGPLLDRFFAVRKEGAGLAARIPGRDVATAAGDIAGLGVKPRTKKKPAMRNGDSQDPSVDPDQYPQAYEFQQFDDDYDRAFPDLDNAPIPGSGVGSHRSSLESAELRRARESDAALGFSASRVSLPWGKSVGSESQRGSGVMLGSDGPVAGSEGGGMGQGSVRSSIGDGSGGGGGWSGDDGSHDLVLDSLQGSTQSFAKDSQDTVRGAEESHSFLEYAKAHAARDGTSYVYLTDLVGNLHSRTASAQAFYHVLYLVSNREMSVSQARPFADIKMQFSEDDLAPLLGRGSSRAAGWEDGSGAAVAGSR
ncbi:hypothetical protein HDU98_004779, partial [Podochytrium sp. JEL0797]